MTSKHQQKNRGLCLQQEFRIQLDRWLEDNPDWNLERDRQLTFDTSAGPSEKRQFTIRDQFDTRVHLTIFANGTCHFEGAGGWNGERIQFGRQSLKELLDKANAFLDSPTPDQLAREYGYDTWENFAESHD